MPELLEEIDWKQGDHGSWLATHGEFEIATLEPTIGMSGKHSGWLLTVQGGSQFVGPQAADAPPFTGSEKLIRSFAKRCRDCEVVRG